ncbi:MAG: glycerol dehydratase reactivase beta/small subunit family protein [Mycolicibacterium cosmeticum]|nr:glycerol dehydratase reactivase beta/small subunit family protein [Mycolicibacterium cosmeticum]
MREGGQPVPPAILVISCGAVHVEQEVLAGVEEEGVPAILERQVDDGDAHSLARVAAVGSSLGVGIGIDAAGVVSVQHEKLGGPIDGLFGGSGSARTLGHNAARIVVGIPLLLVGP